MPTITIPNEVYLVALDYMGVDRPADPGDAPSALMSAEGRQDYREILATQCGIATPITAFGLALAQCVSSSGPFDDSDDGDGEFAGCYWYADIA